MVTMPSSKNRKRLEVPTYYHDALKNIADAEDRTVANVLGELLFSALQSYQPTWIPKENLHKLTVRARRVVDRAHREVPAQFNHNYIGTETLLLALAEESDGLGGQVLARHGITPQFVHDSIETIIGRGDAPPAEPPELTPRARKVLALAVAEAARLDHNFVGTGHLLLGIIREGQGIATGILERGGVELPVLRDAVLQALVGREVPLAET
jgi:ATP-dependent Clp protease ATP-binding subunit ClpC